MLVTFSIEQQHLINASHLRFLW